MSKPYCHISKKHYNREDLLSYSQLMPSTIKEIRQDYPDFNTESYISYKELFRYRQMHIEKLINKESDDITELEKKVLDALKNNRVISDNIEPKLEPPTFGERVSDKIASFGGSWKFIIGFCVFIIIWMFANYWLLKDKGFDPYPFILLNLVLSCLAALQAPVIMMSQNRQETKDRNRSENDYQINLTAELQIRMLHEKVDHIIIKQFANLMETQDLQMKTLNDLQAQLNEHTNKGKS